MPPAAPGHLGAVGALGAGGVCVGSGRVWIHGGMFHGIYFLEVGDGGRRSLKLDSLG